MQVMKEPLTQLMYLEAFSAWEDIVGADYITIDSNDLKSANCATFLTHKKNRAILYPKNQFEISEFVAAVPEPGSAIVICGSLFLLNLRRRRVNHFKG